MRSDNSLRKRITVQQGHVGLITVPNNDGGVVPLQRATTWVLFRCVVEGLALINDVNGQQLDRLITDDFISAVRYVPYV